MLNTQKGFLDNSEIKAELQKLRKSNGSYPSDDLIDDLIQQFWFRDFSNSFIAIPKHFDLLKEYLLKNKPSHFNRLDFYRFFFKKLFNKKKVISLQKVGLVSELMHDNKFPEKEFNALIKKSGLDKKDLIKSGLFFKIKDEESKQNFIQWRHHTLSEFLAAEHILAHPKSLETASSLMILNQEKIRAFKYSWAGTLRFLFESEKPQGFIFWILDFLEENPDSVDEVTSDVLMTVDPAKVPAKTRKRIFDLIYDTYYKRVLWLPLWSRYKLAKFVGQDRLESFKKDIRKKPSGETKTFVHRGNVVTILDTLLKDKRLDDKDHEYWKKKLIKFANDKNDNGVLQRHSLRALARYKDKKIIKKVAGNFEHPDSLVKEAFITFCYESAPDSEETIGVLVKGIEQDLVIYSRHGLYAVTDRESIKYLLNKFISNDGFLKKFLDKEEIFNAGKKKGDQKLISNIMAVMDEEIVELLKKIIFNVLSVEEARSRSNRDGSYFLQALAILIQECDPNYIFEILAGIQQNIEEGERPWSLLSIYENIFALLIDSNNLVNFYQVYEQLDKEFAQRNFEFILGKVRRLRAKDYEKLHKLAVVKEIINDFDEEAQKQYDLKQEGYRRERYRGFLERLGEGDKFRTDLFAYYVNNKDQIEKYWELPQDRQKLIESVKMVMSKMKPREIQVKLSKTEGNRNFTWSSAAAFFGDAVRAAQILAPDLLVKHKQKIIDFIPFAFSSDMSTILDVVETVTDEELTWVNSIFLSEKDDKRYLIPSSYIFIVGQMIERGCSLPSVREVLQSLFSDPELSLTDRLSCLSGLAQLADFSSNNDYEYFKNLRNKYSNWDDSDERLIFTKVNEILIEVFRDEEAINWRFKKVKGRFKKPLKPGKLSKTGEFHWVGSDESELHSLSFVKPLTELNNEKHLNNFLDLLALSLKKVGTKDENKFWASITYVWRAAISFVDHLKTRGSFAPLLELEDWVDEYAKTGNATWLQARVRQLRLEYINHLGKKNLQAALEEVGLEGK